MIVRSLELIDFRNYRQASFVFVPGTTAIVGLNGQGKTNLAEALGYLATQSSFRGAPNDALVRVGADTAVIRAEVIHPDGREVLVEMELARVGRSRVQVNRQRLGRARDLLGAFTVSVFSTDDLEIVKGAPAQRRRMLDDVLIALAVKYDAMRIELDRVVRQRNTLLKQCAGRLDDATAATLDVWDLRLTQLGERFGHARAVLAERLSPQLAEAYRQLAEDPVEVGMRYVAPWLGNLAGALADARADDLRRATTTLGPHRDELDLSIAGMPARTHASQGEQRSLALALRLAAHRLVAERLGDVPVLLLDDVLSELDPHRAAALLNHLPAGQVLLTTAGVLPEAAHPDAVVTIVAGEVVGGSPGG